MSLRLYVEGGGDHNKALQTLCRQGFSEFIRKCGLGGRMPRIVACGGRQQAYKSFRTAHAEDEGMRPAMLLVDSEGPVPADQQDPWAYVKLLPGHQRERPRGTSDDQLQLMVQVMEAWFLADRNVLAEFYGQPLNSLSPRADIENIPKQDLLNSLEAATVHCKKGKYSKGEHSFQILARIDPARVRAASPIWAERFVCALDRICR